MVDRAPAGHSLSPPSRFRPAQQLRDQRGSYDVSLAEHELVALWLLGRVPEAVLPWPLMRAGRAGRGPGPDVREAVFQHPSGVPLAGDVEVHLRASDFVRHGHATDPGYNGLVLHLVWEDDRANPGAATELPSGDFVLTVEVGPALGGRPSALRELLRLGPSGGEPCGEWAATTPADRVTETVRAEGRRRLAERAWGAGRLVELNGWAGAWDELLIRALRASAGRRRESAGEQRGLAARINAALVAAIPTARDGSPPPGAASGAPAPADPASGDPHLSDPASGGRALAALERLAREERPSTLIEALRQPGGPGRARAVEIGWNAALPLLAAAAAAYGDRELAATTAVLVDRWPAPRPYGRTEALALLIRPPGPPPGGGMLRAQGLLHLQDLWCERGGCGVCPLSGPSGGLDEASA